MIFEHQNDLCLRKGVLGGWSKQTKVGRRQLASSTGGEDLKA